MCAVECMGGWEGLLHSGGTRRGDQGGKQCEVLKWYKGVNSVQTTDTESFLGHPHISSRRKAHPIGLPI